MRRFLAPIANQQASRCRDSVASGPYNEPIPTIQLGETGIADVSVQLLVVVGQHLCEVGHISLPVDAEPRLAVFLGAEREPAAEKILDLAYTLDHVIESIARVRNGQEVMQVHAVNSGPAEVIGDPRGIDALGEPFEAWKVVEIEGRGRCD